MKTKFNYIILLKIFFLVICTVENLGAQPAEFGNKAMRFPYIKNQMAVTLAYNKTQLIPMTPPFEVFEGIVRGINVGTLYAINGWLECGIAVDFNICNRLNIQFLGYDKPIVSYMSVYQTCIGQQAKAHLLSVFWEDFSFLDLYLSETIGMSCVFVPYWVKAKFGFLAQGGAGVGINPSRHFGFFFEYGLNNRRNKYTLLGLNIRFGGPKKWRNTRQ